MAHTTPTTSTTIIRRPSRRGRAKARVSQIKARMCWMHDNLVGCDWCCGGGDEEYELLSAEMDLLLRDLEA